MALYSYLKISLDMQLGEVIGHKMMLIPETILLAFHIVNFKLGTVTSKLWICFFIQCAISPLPTSTLP
jgi:hypothetical protein